MFSTTKSFEYFKKACSLIPGGVNSPVRNFALSGITPPLYISSGKGSRITDVDGNTFVDYVCSWGAIVTGHSDPKVIESVKSVIDLGFSFGACHSGEVLLAEALVNALPSLQKVRLVNSGTEAVMSVVRLARGFTGKKKIIKFEGCYHGHSDAMLVKAGSGVLHQREASSLGVLSDHVKDTLVVPYNNFSAVEDLFKTHGDDIAAVIVEPAAANMGVVPPKPHFLSHLRQVCSNYSSLLIFDEVITGFRLNWQGAQGFYGIQPDLTCLGKIIGGGLPIGAYGGRKEIMEMVAPAGGVYQAGTLSGNPIAVAAGLATLKGIEENPSLYQHLHRYSQNLAEGVSLLAKERGIPCQVNALPGLLSFFWTENPIFNFVGVKKSNQKFFISLFSSLLNAGIYIAPSPYEALFLSASHGDRELDQTLSAFRKAFTHCSSLIDGPLLL